MNTNVCPGGSSRPLGRSAPSSRGADRNVIASAAKQRRGDPASRRRPRFCTVPAERVDRLASLAMAVLQVMPCRSLPRSAGRPHSFAANGRSYSGTRGHVEARGRESRMNADEHECVPRRQLAALRPIRAVIARSRQERHCERSEATTWRSSVEAEAPVLMVPVERVDRFARDDDAASGALPLASEVSGAARFVRGQWPLLQRRSGPCRSGHRPRIVDARTSVLSRVCATAGLLPSTLRSAPRSSVSGLRGPSWAAPFGLLRQPAPGGLVRFASSGLRDSAPDDGRPIRVHPCSSVVLLNHGVGPR